MQDWQEIKRWRREQRERLIQARRSLPQDERRRSQALICAETRRLLPDLAGTVIGFYWPFRGEIGLHGLVRELIDAGANAALPVVIEKAQPLAFWAWQPGAPLGRGIWNIPIPAERRPVHPTVLLVPLVGFDGQGYRLGYGGGYYDRTLASLAPRPLTIGVGYALGRLATIHPQPHDVPLDVIVTEAGGTRFPRRAAHEEEERREFASSPCSLHEFDDFI